MPSISSNPKTVEEIFKDYSSRRSGIVRALTHGTSFTFLIYFSVGICLKNWFWFVSDVDEFYNLCDPGNLKLVYV